MPLTSVIFALTRLAIPPLRSSSTFGFFAAGPSPAPLYEKNKPSIQMAQTEHRNINKGPAIKGVKMF